MIEPSIVAVTLGGMLTAVSILWTLNMMIFWRAVDSPQRIFLGWFQLLITALALLAVLSALWSLNSLARSVSGWLVNLPYTISMVATVLLALIIAGYYAILAIAYIRRDRP